MDQSNLVQAQITPQKLPPISELISESWRIISSKIKSITFLYLTTLLISSINGFLPLLGIFAVVTIFTSKLSFPVLLIAGVFIIFAIIVGAIISAWPQLALIVLVGNRQENISIRQAFGRTRVMLLPYLLLLFLENYLVTAGFLLFVVPGILLFFSFLFFQYVFVMEGLRGFNALLKSNYYIKGFRGAVFWRYVVILLIWTGLYMVTQQLTGLIIPLDKSTLGSPINPSGLAQTALNLQPLVSKVLVNVAIIRIVSSFVSTAIVIFVSVYTYLLYEHLKQIKGAFEFKPSRKSKVLLGTIGILGVIVFVVIGVLFSRVTGLGFFGAIGPSGDDTIYLPGLDRGGRQFKSARDTQRKADLYGIQNALYQFKIEHGVLPDTDGDDSISSFPTRPICIGFSTECFMLEKPGPADAVIVLIPR